MQNELYRTGYTWTEHWSLVTNTNATVMPCNTGDKTNVTIQHGGVVLLLKLWLHGCRQADGRRCLMPSHVVFGFHSE